MSDRDPLEVYAVDNSQTVFCWPWESRWSDVPDAARKLYEAAEEAGLSAWLAAAEDLVTVSASSPGRRFTASWRRTPAGAWTSGGAFYSGGPERWHQEPETRAAERTPPPGCKHPLSGYGATRMVYDSGAYPRKLTVTDLKGELAR